jgi:hypothetical protein
LKCLKKLIYEAIFTYLKPRNDIDVPDNIFQKKLKQLDTSTTYDLLIQLNDVLFKEIKDNLTPDKNNPTPQIVSDITKYVIDTHRTSEDKYLFEKLFLYALKLNKTGEEPDDLTIYIENIIRSNTELSELLEKYKFVTNNISNEEIKMIQSKQILLISILISQLIKLSTEITNSEEEIMESKQEPDELLDELDDYIEEQPKTQTEIEQEIIKQEIIEQEIIELLQLDKLELERLKIDDEEDKKFIDQQFDYYIGQQISDDDINKCAVQYLSSVDITEGGKRIRKQKTIKKRKQKTIKKRKQKTIRKRKN